MTVVMPSSSVSFASGSVRAPTFTKRSVQVAPRRSVSRAVVLVQQPVHPFFCYFEDRDVEQKFQTYFYREWQSRLVVYMGLVVLLSATSSFESTSIATLAVTEAYVQAIVTAVVSFGSSNVAEMTAASSAYSHALWLDDGAFAGVAATLYAVAMSCAVFLWRRRGEHRFPHIRLDLVQLVLLFYSHLVLAPLLLVLLASIEKQARYTKQINEVHDDQARHIASLLGEGFLDALLFTELLAACICAYVLRLQSPYFAVMAIELTVIASAVTGVHLTTHAAPNRRLAILGMFLSLLLLMLRSVLEQERGTRREFLTSFHLVTEARRLSSINFNTKEELSGKLNYQLHYEMGDILRILCQLKVKMSSSEKHDIDKIITALVRNQDLFEVTLDSAMPEYDEEVQGWLHMMAFREHPVASTEAVRAESRVGSHRGSERRSRIISTPHKLLRVASSRRFSRKAELDNSYASDGLSLFFNGRSVHEAVVGVGNGSESVSTFIMPYDPDKLSNWLLDRLQNHFFVDMFHLEQHCASPLQAVLLACVQLNHFTDRLPLNEQKLAAFGAIVESHYHSRNPYHNCLVYPALGIVFWLRHAAAVVADINFYLRRVHLSVDDSTLFVGLIAAAAHDIAHPGVSNGFLIATKSELAITYSDDSVLERMHVAELYHILAHDEFDVFEHMAVPERAEARKIIVGMILATDLARHFSRISLLKTKKFAVSEEDRGLELPLLMETLLMLSDLGHTAKPFAYHQGWAERISEEFFRQGEAEELHNLPVSPLCDRRQANLPRSQVTFLTLVATPLFETAGQVFAIDEYDCVVSELRANIATWKERIEQTEGAMLETMSLDSTKLKLPADKS
ncbi:hypothetical protein BBJ28_00009601 [Nothophytophthora sp. Chile5]|nr:hypothetical protein BBJ28_00009601 [Nothophytophthora sp. Chile5]